MSDDNETVGRVEVRIKPSDVHKAVRNILANEMKLDPVAVKDEVRAHAEKIIQEQVISYLEGNGWGQANLYERVNRALTYYEGKIETMVQKAVENLVRSHIEKHLGLAVEAIFQKAQFNIRWTNTTVKVSAEEVKE